MQMLVVVMCLHVRTQGAAILMTQIIIRLHVYRKVNLDTASHISLGSCPKTNCCHTAIGLGEKLCIKVLIIVKSLGSLSYQQSYFTRPIIKSCKNTLHEQHQYQWNSVATLSLMFFDIVPVV